MIALFLSAAIILGVVLLYRKSLFTALLRGIAVIALFLIISGFSFPVRKSTEHRLPVVLVDASQSTHTYMDSIQGFLRDIQFANSTYYFSERRIVSTVDSIDQYGVYTDIIGAIEAVKPTAPQAILLVSDGNHNYEGTSLTQLRAFDIPVFAFGIGAERQQDVELLDVLCPDYVYLNDSFDIEVTVQSYGYDAGTATVELVFNHSKIKQQRSFQLSSTKTKNTLTFHTEFRQRADTIITVTVLPSPGEENTHNNTKQQRLTPIDHRIKTVYYTDHVSFNTKFTLTALDQHSRFDVTYIARMPSGRYIDPRSGSVQPLPRLDTVNALILDNVSCAILPWPQVPEAVKTGLGILCMGTIQQITPSWQTMLPIVVAEVVTQGDQPVHIVSTFSCLSTDRTYPPIPQMQRILSVHEKAVVLARAGTVPAIAYQRYGQGTVFQMNIVTVGTWHFMQQGIHQVDILSCLLPDAIRFIAPEGRNKRLILAVQDHNSTVGERVECVLKSYDLDFRPAGGGDFWIEVNNRKIPFFETQKGTYRTSFIMDKPGELTITASGTLTDEPLSSNPITFDVRTGDLEHVRTINRTFLEKIAQYTGGAYLPIDSLPGFTVPASVPDHTTLYVSINNPLTYLLIGLLLFADWIIRRRRGMV